MFGIGFTELLLIFIIAILFLGPDKLPGALVDMAKFIKSVKKTIGDAKSSLEEEMKIADLKEEALSYKKQLDDATSELKNFKNINFDDFDDVSYGNEVSNKKDNDKKEEPIEPVATQIEAPNDTVTFKKKNKKQKESDDETAPSTKKGDA